MNKLMVAVVVVGAAMVVRGSKRRLGRPDCGDTSGTTAAVMLIVVVVVVAKPSESR